MPKYDFNNIPARVFFQILETKNFQLLKPKPREKGLEEHFLAIYDEFFIKSDNLESKRYLELTNEIAVIKNKIFLLKRVLLFYHNIPHTKEMILQLKESLKKGYDIDYNENEKFIDEALRISREYIGIYENDLVFLESDLKELMNQNKNKTFDYNDTIMSLANVLQGNTLIKEEMLLTTYISANKLAKEKIEQQKKKK